MLPPQGQIEPKRYGRAGLHALPGDRLNISRLTTQLLVDMENIAPDFESFLFAFLRQEARLYGRRDGIKMRFFMTMVQDGIDPPPD